ncbi:MAG: type II secretion system protein [Acidobacteriota bacterium]
MLKVSELTRPAGEARQCRLDGGRTIPARHAGFTLIELMVVVAIMGILVSIALPTYRHAVQRAKEAVLKQNLMTIRDVLDQYYADKGHYPDSLQDLVSAGYFRSSVPVDPMTGKANWVTVPFTGQDEGQLEPTGNEQTGGIWDVHSASDEVALDGTKYSTW